jgi:hypothetical protein
VVNLPAIGSVALRSHGILTEREDAAWNRAAAATEQGDPFCCRTEWQLSFNTAFHPGRPLRFGQGDDSVVAFAESRHPMLGLVLEPVESHWCFGCPLLGAHALETLDAFLREWPATGPDAPSVLLSGLLPDSALLRRLTAKFGSRYEIVQPDEPQVMCCASLEGGLDGFLSRRSSKLRRRLRQAARHAREAGVTYERHSPRSAADSEATYARMLAVEGASWKGIGRCGMTEPPAREFYAAMLRRLAPSGAARVMFARHGEEDIGFIFGGLAGSIYRGQQFSYAEGWRSFTVGSLLQVEQVTWLCEEGATRYDMGPLMDYKRHWTEAEIRIELRLLRPARRLPTAAIGPGPVARANAAAAERGRRSSARRTAGHTEKVQEAHP